MRLAPTRNQSQSPAQASGRDPLNQAAARTFSELLYRYRLMAGISRMELAERVLCSENYIYRLESRDPRHRRVPTPWIVRALAEALALSADQSDGLLRARDRLERDITRRDFAATAPPKRI